MVAITLKANLRALFVWSLKMHSLIYDDEHLAVALYFFSAARFDLYLHSLLLLLPAAFCFVWSCFSFRSQ